MKMIFIKYLFSLCIISLSTGGGLLAQGDHFTAANLPVSLSTISNIENYELGDLDPIAILRSSPFSCPKDLEIDAVEAKEEESVQAARSNRSQNKIFAQFLCSGRSAMDLEIQHDQDFLSCVSAEEPSIQKSRYLEIHALRL